MKSFKLNLLAVGAMLAAGAAQAQYANVSEDKNVEFFGVLGSGFVSGTGFGTATQRDQSWTGISDQPHSSNRVGARGQRVMDEDVFVRYVVEANFSLRDGTVGKDSGGTGKFGSSATTAIFDREANFAIGKKDIGQVQFGRGKNFLYNVADDFDSRGNWNLGGLKPIARYAGFYGGSGVSRFDNMLRISSAPFNNVRFDFAKSYGNQMSSSTTTDGKSNSTNWGLRYTNGPLDVAYTMASLKIGTEYINQKVNLTAVKYEVMPGLTLNVGNATTKNPSGITTFATTANTTALKVDGATSAGTNFYGAKYRLNERVTLNAGIYSVTDKVQSGANNIGMNAYGAQYALGKNAEVFIDFITASRKGTGTAPFTIYDRWYPDSSSPSESVISQHAVSIGAQIRF